MRIIASGNLTVELIRAHRFDMACHIHASGQDQHTAACKGTVKNNEQHPIDKVELSPQALASDPWAVDAKRVNAVLPAMADADLGTEIPDLPSESKRLSPVVGSPALAGLGAAWVVPGTLLDVVA
ncbi:MAG: hypothetical protein KTR15_04030 [Phycisphaeraceae bacterium]|nr:hypothetical protein [Phycisphaeraceae bacterium]